MDSLKRNQVINRVGSFFPSPLFYTECEFRSYHGEGKKDFVLDVFIGIRPMVIKDYKRKLLAVEDCEKKMWLFEELTTEERSIIHKCVERFEVEVALKAYFVRNHERPNYCMLYQFR